MTSYAVASGIPPRLASMSASPAATRWMNASMFVMTLITDALPSGPTWMTGAPIASSSSRCAAKTASSPPAMTVISPAAALWTPPVTGHSSVAMPRSASSAARRSSSCASFVLMSIHVPPRRRPSAIPPGPETTALTAAGDGRQVITQSEASATARGEAAGARAGVGERGDGRRLAIVHREREAPGEHARGEVAAEVAETDEADVHGESGRTVCSPGRGSRCSCVPTYGWASATASSSSMPRPGAVGGMT